MGVQLLGWAEVGPIYDVIIPEETKIHVTTGPARGLKMEISAQAPTDKLN